MLEKHCLVIHQRSKAVLKEGQVPLDQVKNEECEPVTERSELSEGKKMSVDDKTGAEKEQGTVFARCEELATVEDGSRSLIDTDLHQAQLDEMPLTTNQAVSNIQVPGQKVHLPLVDEKDGKENHSWML